MNFKTLKAFFNLQNEDVETPETPEVKNDGETDDDAPDAPEEEEPQAAIPTIGGVAVDQARVDALVGAEAALATAQAELLQFGATTEARASFLSESRQLYTWYENQKKINVSPTKDANAEEKNKAKKVHPITQEAIDLQAKRAGK